MEDLFCTYFGQNKLYRNNGDGTFTDVSGEGRTRSSLDHGKLGAGSSFVDYDRDGPSGPFHFQLHSNLILRVYRNRARTLIVTGREYQLIADPAVFHPGFRVLHVLYPATTAMAHLPMLSNKSRDWWAA